MLVERPNIAQRQCPFASNLLRIRHRCGDTLGTKQPFEQRIHLATGFVLADQGRDRALAGASGTIAKRLNQLHVDGAARSGELGERNRHVAKTRSIDNRNCQHPTSTTGQYKKS